MDVSTPVEARTKEPFAMDDQSSVVSNMTYQAAFDDRSQIDISAYSTTKNSPNAIDRTQSRFAEESTTFRSSATSEHQYDDRRPAIEDFMTIPKSNDRGRSKSPRPKVSAATRARWAMLKSLAGVPSGEDAEDEAETATHIDENKAATTALEINSEAQDSAALRPLLLGDHSSDAASIELYLSKLEHDPHIDSRALQEGLQASGLRRGNSLRNQQVRDLNRGPRRLESEIQNDARKAENEVRSDASRLMQKGEGEVDRGSRLIERNGHAFENDLAMGGRNVEGAMRAGEADLQHHVQNGKQDVRRDLHDLAGGAEADLHKLDGQDLARDLQNRGHGFEADIKDATRVLENQLPGLDVRQDVRRGEHALEAGFSGAIRAAEVELPGRGLRQDVRRGERDMTAGFENASRLVQNALPDFDIRRDIQKGERDLKEELHKLEGESVFRGLDQGEKALKAELNSAEEAAKGQFSGLHTEQDIQRGEHVLMNDLHVGVGLAKTELGRFEGHGMEQDVRKGEHALMNGLHEGINLAEKELNKIEGRGLGQGIRSGEHDFAVGLQGGINLAEKELDKLEGHGLGGLEKGGRSIENAVDRLGASAIEHVRTDSHDLARDAQRASQHFNRESNDSKSMAERAIQNGEKAVKGAFQTAQALGNGGQTHAAGVETQQQLQTPQQRPPRQAPPVIQQASPPHQLLQQHPASQQSIRPHQPPQQQPRPQQTMPPHQPPHQQQARPQQAMPPHQPPPQQQARPQQAMPPRQPPSQQQPRPQQAMPPHQQNPAPFQSVGPHQLPGPRQPLLPQQLNTPSSPQLIQARMPNNAQQLHPARSPAVNRVPSPAASENNRRPMLAMSNPSQGQYKNGEAQIQGAHSGNIQQSRLDDVNSRPIQPSAQALRPNETSQSPQSRAEASVQKHTSTQPQNQQNNNVGKSLTQNPLSHQEFAKGISKPSLRGPMPNMGSSSVPQVFQGPPKSSISNKEVGKTDLQRSGMASTHNPSKDGQGNTNRPSEELGAPQANLQGGEQHEMEATDNNVSTDLGDLDTLNEDEDFSDPDVEDLDESSEFQDQHSHDSCQHEGHEAQACPLKKNWHTEAEETHHTMQKEQSTKPAPSGVDGVNNMISMFKAQSQASIDASGGCVGFKDQMIQLLCKMAQDAMPEVQRRLTQNQRSC